MGYFFKSESPLYGGFHQLSFASESCLYKEYTKYKITNINVPEMQLDFSHLFRIIADPIQGTLHLKIYQP